MACGILVPWLGIELAPSALETQNLNHWIAREVPNTTFKKWITNNTIKIWANNLKAFFQRRYTINPWKTWVWTVESTYRWIKKKKKKAYYSTTWPEVGWIFICKISGSTVTMANLHSQRHSKSLVIREKQVTTTARHHFTFTRMAVTKPKQRSKRKPTPTKRGNNRHQWGCEGIETWWDCKMVQLLRKTFWQFLNKLAEKALAPHSSTLAWRIPWMEEPGRLQSMGSLRVRHGWNNLAATS